MTASTPGAPDWVDLATADLDGAAHFYGRLFGWDTGESAGYTTYFLGGLPVAGAGPLLGDGQPTAWSTYFATDDADAVAYRVREAGGQLLVAPFDVADQGRMAAFLDPAGAAFSVWQAGTMAGSALFDVPGSLTWNELNTRDVEGARAFYGSVFGWELRDSSMAGPYVVAELDGTAVCGIRAMEADAWPPDMSPHWMVYFAVDDCDAAAGQARTLGGRVLVGPSDLPIGRYAVLEDPAGGLFSVLAGVR